MGCCFSCSSKDRDTKASLTTEIFPRQACGGEGPQVGLSAANWGTQKGFYTVHVSETDIFAAVLGSSGSITALQNCLDCVLKEWQACRNSGPKDALVKTAVRLQRKYGSSAGSQVPLCTALLHVEKARQRMHILRTGAADAVVGELVHGLNLQVTTGKSVFSHKHWSQRPANTHQLPGVQDLDYTELHLQPTHEHIILGTPAFWALLAPDDAALRSHFYLKGSVDLMEDAPPNSAAHLVAFARTKKRTFVTRPGDNATALVVTLCWPATSLNQAFGDKRWLRHMLEQAEAGASVRALRRWQQVKMLHIEYPRFYRQMIVRKWREASALLLTAGRRRAQTVEEAFWKEKRMVVVASPSLKVKDSKGRVVRQDELERLENRPPNFLQLDAYC